MQYPHRSFIPSCAISRTCQKPAKRCKVSSFFSHLSDTTTHNTTSRDPLYFPNRRPQSSLSYSFPPHSKRLLYAEPSSSACLFHPPKAGSLTRAMPNSGRKGRGDPRDIEISKSLSYLLRHGAKTEGIQLDEGGWANVADVVGFCAVSFLCGSWIQSSLLYLTFVITIRFSSNPLG